MQATLFIFALSLIPVALSADSGSSLALGQPAPGVLNDASSHAPSFLASETSSIPQFRQTPLRVLRRNDSLMTAVLTASASAVAILAVAFLVLQCFKAVGKASHKNYSYRRLAGEDHPSEDDGCGPKDPTPKEKEGRPLLRKIMTAVTALMLAGAALPAAAAAPATGLAIANANTAIANANANAAIATTRDSFDNALRATTDSFDIVKNTVDALRAAGVEQEELQHRRKREVQRDDDGDNFLQTLLEGLDQYYYDEKRDTLVQKKGENEVLLKEDNEEERQRNLEKFKEPLNKLLQTPAAPPTRARQPTRQQRRLPAPTRQVATTENIEIEEGRQILGTDTAPTAGSYQELQYHQLLQHYLDRLNKYQEDYQNYERNDYKGLEEYNKLRKEREELLNKLNELDGDSDLYQKGGDLGPKLKSAQETLQRSHPQEPSPTYGPKEKPKQPEGLQEEVVEGSTQASNNAGIIAGGVAGVAGVAGIAGVAAAMHKKKKNQRRNDGGATGAELKQLRTGA